MAATQVESFCERCGTKYTFDQRAERGRRLRGLGRTLGFLAEDSVLDDVPLASRDPFHGTFRFCLECRQYTCPSCWNETAGFCQGCAPLANGTDMADAEVFAAVEAASDLRDAMSEINLLRSPEAWPGIDLPPVSLMEPVSNGAVPHVAEQAAFEANGFDGMPLAPVIVSTDELFTGPWDFADADSAAEDEAEGDWSVVAAPERFVEPPAEIEADEAEVGYDAFEAELADEPAVLADADLSPAADVEDEFAAGFAVAEFAVAEFAAAEESENAELADVAEPMVEAVGDDAEAAPVLELEGEIETSAEYEAEPELELVADADADLDVAAEAEPEFVAEADADLYVAAEAVAESEPEFIADAEAEPTAEFVADAEAEFVADAEAEPTAEIDFDAETAPEAEPEPLPMAAAAVTPPSSVPAPPSIPLAATVPPAVLPSSPTWMVPPTGAVSGPPMSAGATPAPFVPPAASSTPPTPPAPSLFAQPTQPSMTPSAVPASRLAALFGRGRKPDAPPPPMPAPGALPSGWRITAEDTSPQYQSAAFLPQPQAPVPQAQPPRPSLLAQPGHAHATPGIRPCFQCSLPLSSTARFCRRCGTPQQPVA